jgi:transcriptional regulator with XRE-family HTH domain
MPGRKRASSNFGRWLDKEMDRLDMNMSGLARLVGVSQSAVSDWRQGKNTPNEDNVRSLAGALHVPVTDVHAALGRIPPDEETPEQIRRILAMLDTASDEMLEEYEAWLRWRIERESQRGKGTQGSKAGAN